MGWIEQNQGAPDFEEELFLVGESKSSGPKKDSAFAGMSKEEKAVAAKELQAKIRAKMKAEEEKNKAENELAYAQAQKELAKAKRINDEREAENAIEQQKREKKEFLAQKKKMIE